MRAIKGQDAQSTQNVEIRWKGAEIRKLVGGNQGPGSFPEAKKGVKACPVELRGQLSWGKQMTASLSISSMTKENFSGMLRNQQILQ